MEKEKLMKDTEYKKESSIKEAFLKWSGLFLVIIASLAIFLIAVNMEQILDIIIKYLGFLRPVIFGCVIAYILNPLMKLYQNLLTKLIKPDKRKKTDKMKGMINGLSITLAIFSGIIVIIVLCWMIIPQVIESITSLVNNLPQKANYYYNQINENIRNNKFLAGKIQDTVLEWTDSIDKKINSELLPWMRTELLPGVNTVAIRFANGVMSFVSVLYNLFIGLIVAIYILASKDTFSAQAKKFTYGIFKKKSADLVIHYIRVSNDMFSGFITGKIVDSTILGFLCFFIMWILGLPYAVLISVIVGVTNIIPVFGPYIGLIPSVLFILMVNPKQAIVFIIMIAILQQIDGNIIGPAILGESTGLSAFWVLFSILLFGGMWGILGMIVGVPLFAVIYRIITDFINWKLKNKQLSTMTDNYRNLKKIDIDPHNQISYIQFTEEELNEKNEKKQERRRNIKNKFIHVCDFALQKIKK